MSTVTQFPNPDEVFEAEAGADAEYSAGSDFARSFIRDSLKGKSDDFIEGFLDCFADFN